MAPHMPHNRASTQLGASHSGKFPRPGATDLGSTLIVTGPSGWCPLYVGL